MSWPGLPMASDIDALVTKTRLKRLADGVNCSRAARLVDELTGVLTLGQVVGDELSVLVINGIDCQ